MTLNDLPWRRTEIILLFLRLHPSTVPLVAQMVKRLPAMWDTWVQSLNWEDPLEKETATHSSTLAWEVPWTEEPGRLQSVGSQSQTRLSNFTSLHFRLLLAMRAPCILEFFCLKLLHLLEINILPH